MRFDSLYQIQYVAKAFQFKSRSLNKINARFRPKRNCHEIMMAEILTKGFIETFICGFGRKT